MINKVGRFCLAKGVKFVWLFQYLKSVFYNTPVQCHEVVLIELLIDQTL